jgi:hypothetical protein
MAPKRSRKEESEEESGAEETPVVTTKPSGSVTVPVPDKQTDAEGHTYFEVSLLCMISKLERDQIY